MKILVFSDSHGRFHNMEKALSLHSDAKYILHLGDGTSDLDFIDTKSYTVHKVNGNYEDSFLYTHNGLPFFCFEVENKKIYMCHGHRHNVRFSMQNLCYSAIENNADIVLYGHTHIKHNEYISSEKLHTDRENGLYIFNPGSISRPRDSIYPSYGIIEIQDGGILLSHGIIKE